MTIQIPYGKDTPLFMSWLVGGEAARTGEGSENPYSLDESKKAWDEGFTASNEHGPVNPHRAEGAEDTSLAFPWETGFRAAANGVVRTENTFSAPLNRAAWEAGWDAFVITHTLLENAPPPFDPKSIDLTDDGVELAYGKMNVDGTLRRFIYPVWVGSHEGRPEWLSISAWDRRIISLGKSIVRSIARNALNGGEMSDGDIELPCPPYDYEYTDDGKLRITAGAFTKEGARDEWQGVIDEMQQQVEDMPEGIDIGGLEVTASVSASLTVKFSADAAGLLEYHDSMNGTVWMGSTSELLDALNEEGAAATEQIEYDDPTQHDEYEVDSMDDAEFSSYDLEQALSNL